MSNNIFIIGYYGYGNLGDEAMRLGLLNILEYKGYENVRVYSKGRSILRNIWWADDVILGGGTHLRNWGKGWLKQSARILLFGLFIRLLGKKFHMLNVGIEGEYLEVLADWVSNTLTLRDEESFDSSIVLDFKSQGKKNILGISLTPVYQIYYDDKNKDRKLAENLMVKVNAWLKENPDYRVKFFNFNKADEEFNLYAMSLTKQAEFRYYQSNVPLVLEEFSECSAFIGMRYHSCQFAYKTETPLIVINAYPSCKQFAEFIGVSSLDKEDILLGNFELKFKKSPLNLIVARALAFGGVRI